MNADRLTRTVCWDRARSVLSLGLLSVAGVCGFFYFDSTEVLQAEERQQGDADGDGMYDAQELVIGSASTQRDTDADGFTDLEEFARQSSPTTSADIPVHAHVSASMSARGEDGRLRIYTAIFQSPSSAGQVDVRIGMLANSRLISIPNWYIALHSEIYEVTTPNGVVTIIDMRVSPKTVRVGQSISWFVYAFDRADDRRKSAAVADVFNVDHVHVLRMAPAEPPGASFAHQIDGSVYRPIPPSGTVPGEWVLGQICMRSSMTVAVDGAILTQEVVEAECVEDWDASCSGDACAGSLGSTFQTIDPVVLVGN